MKNRSIRNELLMKKDYPDFDKTRSESQTNSIKLSWTLLYALGMRE